MVMMLDFRLKVGTVVLRFCGGRVDGLKPSWLMQRDRYVEIWGLRFFSTFLKKKILIPTHAEEFFIVGCRPHKEKEEV